MATQPASQKSNSDLLSMLFVMGVLFSILILLSWVVGFVVNLLSYLASTVVPGALRDGFLWFANVLLPVVTPYLRWMNSFGENWKGLILVVTTVLGLIVKFAGKSRSSEK